jgi:hypothetical protein
MVILVFALTSLARSRRSRSYEKEAELGRPSESAPAGSTGVSSPSPAGSAPVYETGRGASALSGEPTPKSLPSTKLPSSARDGLILKSLSNP